MLMSVELVKALSSKTRKQQGALVDAMMPPKVRALTGKMEVACPAAKGLH